MLHLNSPFGWLDAALGPSWSPTRDPAIDGVRRGFVITRS
jgi:hypothetical protein